MFIWNHPELSELKKKTANEPGWRRVVAIIFALAFVIIAGFTGAVLGVLIVNWLDKEVVTISLDSLLSDDLSKTQVMVSVLFMAICIPLSVIAWEYMMRLTKFVCEDTIKRIKRFGPY